VKVKKLHIKKKHKPPEENHVVCLTVKKGRKWRVQRLKYSHGSFTIVKNSRFEDLREVQMYEKPNIFGFSMLFDKYEYWATETQAERNEFLLGLLEHCKVRMNI